MQTVFSIIGPTAVGKTSAAFHLAEFLLDQKFKNVHLISADSRQVYKGLEILTGADVPEGFVEADSENYEFPYLENGRIKLHGISIIKPEDDWSVAHFQQMAMLIIENAGKNHDAVIIIGGTGLYHDHLFSEDPQLQIGPDENIRDKAQNLSVEELQSWLVKINPKKFGGLNNSDLNNPRRLIRAIEISGAETGIDFKAKKDHPEINHPYIGMTGPIAFISEKIAKRVEDRFGQAVREVEIILGRDITISKPVRTTLGFAQLSAYLNEQITKDQAIEIWTLRETQYAKRQLTWWKKRPEVNWINAKDENWQGKLIKKAKKLLAVKPEIT